jgi:hypothetical protein
VRASALELLRGEPRGGDPYSWGFVRVPVKLKAGTNEFLFSVSRGRLAAKLTPPPAAAFISTLDMLTPSLIAERDTLAWMKERVELYQGLFDLLKEYGRVLLVNLQMLER